MSGPALYRVSYSGRVRQRLVELGAEARARGDGEAFLAALGSLTGGCRSTRSSATP